MLKSLLSTRAARAAAAFAVIAFASGCDTRRDVITVPSLGTRFRATLVGGSAGIYLGVANSTVAAGAFSLLLTTSDGNFKLGITRVGNRPVPGSYALGIDPQTGFAAVLTVGNIVYGNAEGTLTITVSNASEVTGTFTFSSPPTSGGALFTSVSGSFTSSCIGACSLITPGDSIR